MRAETSRVLSYAVVGLSLISIAVIFFGDFRSGCLGISLALLLALVGRILQPEGRGSWLVVRSRRLDIVTLLMLFTAVTFFALRVPQPA